MRGERVGEAVRTVGSADSGNETESGAGMMAEC